MYEIALSVAACLRAGTRVDVAWVVEAQGLGARDMGEALAITPGGGRVGSVLGGSLNDQLTDLSSQGITGRIVDLRVGDVDAQLAGLACGGDARCVLVPATCGRGPVGPAPSPGPGLHHRAPSDGDRRIVGTATFDAETVADAGVDAARLFGGGSAARWSQPGAVTTGASGRCRGS